MATSLLTKSSIFKKFYRKSLDNSLSFFLDSIILFSIFFSLSININKIYFLIIFSTSSSKNGFVRSHVVLSNKFLFCLED